VERGTIYNLKRTRFSRNGHPGRKTKFLPDMLREVEHLARLGARNEDIADFYQVTLTTLEGWLRNNPEFYKAKKRGGIIADSAVVESMYKNATGYQYTKVEKVFNETEKCTAHKETNIDVKGDTIAQIFWLTNRQPNYWKHMNRIIHEGEVKHSHYHKIQDIPVEELSEQTQKMLFELNMKQLTRGRDSN